MVQNILHHFSLLREVVLSYPLTLIQLPINSKMADIGNTSRVTRLSCLASGYSRGSLRLPKKDCQTFNKSLNRTVPTATYKKLIPVDSSLASPAMSFKRKRAEE